MRVIAGYVKGRKIRVVKHPSFRPTSDRVRETLFNILAIDVGDSVFLDCFSGSGAVGIEAISRGAAQVVAVEKERVLAQLIKRNYEDASLLDKVRVINRDYTEAILQLEREKTRFNIAYFDPPYFAGTYEKLLKLVSATDIFDSSIIILEHAKQTKIECPKDLCLTRTSKIGDTHLSFLKKE